MSKQGCLLGLLVLLAGFSAASAGDSGQPSTPADADATRVESGMLLSPSAAAMVQDDQFAPSVSPTGWKANHGTADASTLQVQQVAAMMQPPAAMGDFDLGIRPTVDAGRFAGPFSARPERFDVGVDFYSAPEFEGGLIIYGRDVAMKIGGYVKADFIYDFNPIDNTDSFDTTSIPVGAPRRTNARFHARQTRLSFDTRWVTSEETIRLYVETDFFSDGDRLRLRHAYGEIGQLLVGQTWTTFTDVAAAPATLDFEGSVSNVNRRQAQARWTQTICHDSLTLALAVEDTQFMIETPVGVTGDPRSPSPDFVGHVRWNQEWGQFQIAGVYRIVGFQPTGLKTITAPALGLNFTGVVLLTDSTKAYYQILFGEGIGSYRSLPDAAPTSQTEGKLLPLFGWMVGVTKNWDDSLSSNFTFAINRVDNTALQAADDVRETSYLAANLIASPLDRVQFGIEYLYGTRQNVDFAKGSAHRLQCAFIFDLP